MTLDKSIIASLKGQGIILNRDGQHFSARIVTENGTLSTEQLQALSEAARRYGSGSVSMTVRLSVEIPGIAYENIQPLRDYLVNFGLYSGGTGPRVRPVVPCKGTVCSHGLIDTQGLAKELHEKFYVGWHDVVLPHKFKIGVTGCPNNCIKPGLNDFGIMGQRVASYDAAKCKACKTCNVEAVCPMKICHPGEDGRMVRQTALCTNCGKCIDACPFHAVEETAVGYKIMLGGIWGKRQRLATPLDGVYTKEQLLTILERTLTCWKEQGKKGERFGLFLERVGIDNFTKQLFEDSL